MGENAMAWLVAIVTGLILVFFLMSQGSKRRPNRIGAWGAGRRYEARHRFVRGDDFKKWKDADYGR
jgi:hypothetical protein